VKRALSIRVRLTLWYAAGLALILACLSAGVYWLVQTTVDRALDAQLDRDLATLGAVVAAMPPNAGPATFLPGDVLFMVAEGDRALYQSEAWCRLGLLDAFKTTLPCTSGVWRSQQGRNYRLRSACFYPGGRKLTGYVAEDASVFDALLDRLWQVFLIYLPCAAILSIAGGHFLAGRALSPIGKMASKAREIGAESLSERLPAGNPHDELGRMAAVFNDTLARLEGSFQRLRAFTANVSHELRTPLTAIRSVGEAALERPHNTGSCREAIGSMLEEVDRMTRLVDCLLSLARAENGRAQLPREKVDLAAMAEASLDLVRILAEEKEQSLSLVVTARPIAVGDPATVSQALIDLLDNAIRYTPARGRIEVTVGVAPGGAPTLSVEDNGPGIRAEDRERIFHRFYQAEDAACESTGGVGLGLAIARSAVEANGGRLEYEDAAGGGSKFRITMKGTER
jgi:heavy metal sensor kinase